MAETEPDPVSASDEVDLSTEFNLAQLRRQSMEVSDGVSDIPETGMKQSLSHTNSLPGLSIKILKIFFFRLRVSYIYSSCGIITTFFHGQ